MEQQIGSKLGKEYNKPVYFCSAYLTSPQNISCEILDWMELKLPGEISATSDIIYYYLMAEIEEDLKNL